MPNPLYHRDIISINDLDRSDLELVLNVAASLKKQPQPEFLAALCVVRGTKGCMDPQQYEGG